MSEKGYWIAHVTVTDPERYPDYVAANAEAFEKFDARFLARGGEAVQPEGALGDRHVILEFESFEVAKACYHSQEYAKALDIRKTCAKSDLVIVEGFTDEPGSESSERGYWIAHVQVTDPEIYQTYVESLKTPFEKFNARFLVRGGAFEQAEGNLNDRHIVVEFDSFDTALACYNSDEYAEPIRLRQASTDSDLIVVRGYSG